MTGNSDETLTDTEKLDRLLKIADHLDGMTHDIHQILTEAKPHLEKAVRFLDPGRAMKAYMSNRVKPGRDGST